MEQAIAKLTTAQLDCLISPVRSEILVCLMMSGAKTANDISDCLGCTPESLYHHLKLMQAADLVEIKEIRSAGTQKEAVFGLVAERFDIDGPSDSAYTIKRAEFVAAMLRKAERDYKAASLASLENPELAVFLVNRRVNSRLSKESALELRERIKELVEWMISQDDPQNGTRVTMAIAGLPVVKA